MRKLAVTLGAVAAWLLMGHLGLLAILVYVWASAMASTTNTAKTRAVETRVDALVDSQTTQNQGIAQLNQGIFTNVQGGGSSVSMEGTGVLRVGPLSEFTSLPNTTFLATLSQIGPQANAGGDDNNTGSTWAEGERGYINNAINAINATMGGMVNHGFMAS